MILYYFQVYHGECFQNEFMPLLGQGNKISMRVGCKMKGFPYKKQTKKYGLLRELLELRKNQRITGWKEKFLRKFFSKNTFGLLIHTFFRKSNENVCTIITSKFSIFVLKNFSSIFSLLFGKWQTVFISKYTETAKIVTGMDQLNHPCHLMVRETSLRDHSKHSIPFPATE